MKTSRIIRTRRALSVLLFSIFFSLLFLGVAQAETIYVTESGAGTKDGKSWANAKPGSLLTQVLSPDAVSGTEVWVAKGTYAPPTTGSNDVFFLKEKVKLYGGFAGTETELSQRNLKENVSVLDGGGHGRNWGLVTCNVGGVPEDTRIDGFTITRGNRTSGSPGGGMYNGTNSSPTVANCTFVGNKSSDNGGGMHNGPGTKTVVINCTFAGNTAAYDGGGMNINGSTGASNPIIINCTFAWNTAGSGCAGGAIYSDGSNPIIANTIFWGNSVVGPNGSGEAIWFNVSGSVLLKNCIIKASDIFPAQNAKLTTEAIIEIDPKLIALDAKGTVTTSSADVHIYAISADSSAVDKGLPVGTVISTGATVPDTDQRGVKRPQLEGVDIGAYEYGIDTKPIKENKDENFPAMNTLTSEDLMKKLTAIWSAMPPSSEAAQAMPLTSLSQDVIDNLGCLNAKGYVQKVSDDGTFRISPATMSLLASTSVPKLDIAASDIVSMAIFNATVTPKKTAIMGFDMSGKELHASTVEGVHLLKAQPENNGNVVQYKFAAKPEDMRGGHYMITDEGGKKLPAVEPLVAATRYLLVMAIEDDSEYDLDKTPGKILDPASIANKVTTEPTPTGASQGGGMGGCNAQGLSAAFALLAACALLLKKR